MDQVAEEVDEGHGFLLVGDSCRLLVCVKLQEAFVNKVGDFLEEFGLGEFKDTEVFICKEIGIELAHFEERAHQDGLHIVVLIRDHFVFEEDREAAFDEERRHQVHAVVGQDQFYSQIVLLWVQQNLAIVLSDLCHLETKSTYVLLNDVLFWSDRDVGFRLVLLTHVVEDHLGALQQIAHLHRWVLLLQELGCDE